MSILVKRYSAEWCGPCQMLKPVFQNLKAGFSTSGISFVDVDIDSNREDAINASVRSVPTVIVYKNGQEVSRLIGAKPESAYREELTKALNY